MTIVRGWRLALAWCAFVLVYLHACVGRASTFERDLVKCQTGGAQVTATTFSCTLCGVPVNCDVRSCTWGSLQFTDNGQSQELQLINVGKQLYCVNQGGSMVASASASGMQGATLDRAFRHNRPGSPIQYGGIAEYSNYSGGLSSYGVALPVSYARSFTLDNTDLDLSGDLLFGHNEYVTQYGFTASPTMRYFPQSSAGSKMVYGRTRSRRCRWQRWRRQAPARRRRALSMHRAWTRSAARPTPRSRSASWPARIRPGR